VAIAKAIEAAIGERRGRGNVQNVAQYHGTKTREIAANKAGFENPETYRQARRVVENGVKELVEAMDKGHHARRALRRRRWLME
jgi:acetyl-CoA carboxylase alpha subunit